MTQIITEKGKGRPVPLFPFPSAIICVICG
jgi:hypothetical protein